MSDWISREVAIGALEDRRNKYLEDGPNWLQIQMDILTIRALPAVQPDAAAIREAAQDSEPLPPTSDLPMSLHRWQAWIDDLPLPEDFDAGIAGLQEYLFSLAFPAVHPDLTDPVVVHANMLRGTIAKLTLGQIIHLYGVDALCRALVPVISREAALDEMARLGQEFDAAMKGESHD